MNRLERLFIKKNSKIFSIYFTAGYPQLNDTFNIITELDKAGADMIEIGMPFSDPVADGPVIQKSSEKALLNGMTIKLLFEQIAKVREVTDIPLILMGYINPVFKFGIENFLIKCKETGIDGTIIPDLPVEEYMKDYGALFEKYNISNIFLISPQTPVSRVIYLDSVSKGFLYMVSSSSTTGALTIFDDSQVSYFKKINDLKLNTPRIIGFGISNKETFDQSCKYSNGGIVGSAFIRALDSSGTLPEKIAEFLSKIRV